MRANDLLALGTALFCASCQTDPPRTNPEAVTTAAAVAGQTSTSPAASSAPIVQAPAPAPSASAKAERDEGYCVTAAESIEIAKPHQNAPPPYANCAVGIFAHCSKVEGERGHLCSRPLDVKATEASRKTKPDTCCYRFAD